MASPAQIANDLAAQAAFFRQRDDDVARTCRDAATLIRKMVAAEAVDGRTFNGIHERLLNQCERYRREPTSQIYTSLRRGLMTIETLWVGMRK